MVLSTALALYFHYHFIGNLNWVVISLSFFLPLNSLICLWEIGLGLHINYIKKEYEILREQYKTNPFSAVILFFLTELSVVSLSVCIRSI